MLGWSAPRDSDTVILAALDRAGIAIATGHRCARGPGTGAATDVDGVRTECVEAHRFRDDLGFDRRMARGGDPRASRCGRVGGERGCDRPVVRGDKAAGEVAGMEVETLRERDPPVIAQG